MDLKKQRLDVQRPELYANKVILAPMVRENSLPFRLLCLRHGADLVYTEELIDHRLSKCTRLENNLLETIDYVDDRGVLILRTCPEERDRLVLQIGSNNPERALKSAQLARQDIVGLDFNFGCPKSFSLSGGMGAAMLEKPDEIKALLTTCRENLDIPITCKIRILPDRDATINLVKMIESCGVSAIAVHGRTKTQRPHHDNNDEILQEIAKSLSIPMIANGGSNVIKSHLDVIRFKEKTGASSVMIARAAMKNPSIFKANNPATIESLISDYLKLAIRYNNCFANTKYSLQALMAGKCYGGKFIQQVHSARDFKTICDLFDLTDWFDKNKAVSIPLNKC